MVQKGESFGEQGREKKMKHGVLEKSKRSWKHHKLCFDITHLKCCFGSFFNKTWDHIVIWIHVFSNTNKHKLL